MENDGDAFDFKELATGYVSVFLVLPVDRLTTYGRWLRLVITLAIRAITRAPAPPSRSVLFILDELGTINPGGGLRMVEQAYGLMAGQGIRIWGFLQDLNQLQRDYPNSWQTFIANCEFIQLLKVNDIGTARYFSDFIGQEEEYNYITNKMPDPNRHKKAQPTDLQGYWKTIIVGKEVKGLKMVMRPDEIMGLPADECICLFSGGKTIRARKVNYYTDPRYEGKYRPSPHYVRPAAPKPTAPTPAEPQPIPVAVGPSAASVIADKAAELGRAAAGKVSGWFAARREAAAAASAAREEAEAAKVRDTAQTSAMDERARWAATLKNAK